MSSHVDTDSFGMPQSFTPLRTGAVHPAETGSGGASHPEDVGWRGASQPAGSGSTGGVFVLDALLDNLPH